MKMLIDGEWTDSASGETYEVRDPANGKLLDTVPLGNAGDVRKAADAAGEAFVKWSSMTARERGKILFKAAQLVRDRQKDLATTLTMEQGKPFKEARDEIQGFANILEYYTGISAALEDSLVPVAHGKYGAVLKRPYRRLRRHHPLECARDHHGLESGPGPGDRKYPDTEAVYNYAADEFIPGVHHGRGRIAEGSLERSNGTRRHRRRRDRALSCR